MNFKKIRFRDRVASVAWTQFLQWSIGKAGNTTSTKKIWLQKKTDVDALQAMSMTQCRHKILNVDKTPSAPVNSYNNYSPDEKIRSTALIDQ
jgi:hypothetical protein